MAKKEMTPQEKRNFKIKMQEIRAKNYFEKEILPKSQQPEGEMGVQGFWQDQVLNYLRKQAVHYIGKILIEAKLNAVPKLKQLANDWLDQLSDLIVEKYTAMADDEEKEVFKKKLSEAFPDNPIVKKL